MFSVKKTDRIKDLLNKGVRDGIYPGAVLLVAHHDDILFFQAVGHCMLFPEKILMTPDTIFDLASLTKPLATSLALMKCVDDEKLGLDQPLGSLLSKTRTGDKENLTPRLILAHAAGFADWKPFYPEIVASSPEKRKPLLRKSIMEAPLVYRPGEKTLYSDLGFMVLEWVIEECTGMALHDFLQQNFYAPLSMKKTFFSGVPRTGPTESDQFAATEDCPWRKRVIRGEVSDENAYAVGGYSGHAGLFGTAEDTHTLLDLLRALFLGQREDYLKPETVRMFFTRQDLVKGSTWALGWDTPSPQDSSSGSHFSEITVGHLGYTGTSIWMDLEQDVRVVFLTNRVHPSRENEKIKTFRPALHNLIMEEIVL